MSNRNTAFVGEDSSTAAMQTATSFFQTAVDFQSTSDPYQNTFNNTTNTNSHAVDVIHSNNILDQDIKLPHGVNFVALRETFLSEAPFVKRNNRIMWKKWIDSRQFCNVLASSLRLVNECILDNGSVDAKRLFVNPQQLNLSNQNTKPIMMNNTPREVNLNNASSYNTSMNNTGNKHHMTKDAEDLLNYQTVLLQKVAISISELLIIDKQNNLSIHNHKTDILFDKLPEVLCFMIVNGCISSLPKLTRLFYSIKFRELVLDWLHEMIGGLRITHSQLDKEWVFKESYDTPVLIIDPPVHLSTMKRETLLQSLLHDKMTTTTASTPNSPAPGQKLSLPPLSSAKKPSSSQSGMKQSVRFQGKADEMNAEEQEEMEEKRKEEERQLAYRKFKCSGAKSYVQLTNSPMIQMYMNIGRDLSTEPSYVCPNGFKLSMTHLPDRPIVSMQPDHIIIEGNFRERQMDSKTLRSIIKESKQHRQQILQEKEHVHRDMVHDLHRMKQDYQIHLALLNKKPVSKKYLLQAAANAVGRSKSGTANTSSNNSLSGGLMSSSNSVSGSNSLSGNNSVSAGLNHSNSHRDTNSEENSISSGLR